MLSVLMNRSNLEVLEKSLPNLNLDGLIPLTLQIVL